MSEWRPSAAIDNIRHRAKSYAQIRAFFAARGVLEVDTPIMSHAAVTDPHLASVSAYFQTLGSSQTQTCYLQTSPEYAMKRLLAAGLPSMYQLCKVFRNGEVGRYHNPEFTLLEWYRLDFDEHKLMDEVDALIQVLLGTLPAERIAYEDIFLQLLHVNPHEATVATLKEIAHAQGIEGDVLYQETDKDLWLELLMSHVIEKRIGRVCPLFIYDFPASQAALAKINPERPEIASRFELYYQGIELANGFYELSHAEEQARRFAGDLQKRQRLGLPAVPQDYRLLAALQAGLPECAGVALGVDRVLMIATGATHLDEVIAFPFAVA